MMMTLPDVSSARPHSGSINARAHAANTYGFPLRVNEKICSRLFDLGLAQHTKEEEEEEKDEEEEAEG